MAKVRLQKILPSGLENAIRVAFEGDEMLRDYHILGGSRRAMVEHTQKRILKETTTVTKHTYYRVVMITGEKVQTIGFTVLYFEPYPIFYSFGIGLRWRKKLFIASWMKQVKKKFKGTPIYSYMNEKNRRAIAFLEKNGFVKEHYNAKEKTYMLCQHSEQ